MSRSIFADLKSEANRRTNTELVNTMDMMTALYRGELPPEYHKYMPKQSFHVVPNLIKNAWNDLAADIGKSPELRSEAMDETQREEKRAGLHERIGHSYLKAAEPTQKQLFKRVAWWLVGVGRAVVVVRPDQDKKGPLFSYRDPRTALPNMRTVDGIPVELYDVIFKREIPIDEAIKMGLAPEDKKNTGFGTNQQMVEVYELIDDTAWTVVSEYGNMFREEHNLGVCPAWVFQNFNPDDVGGMSLFQDQISMMVGVSMMISMKIAAADKAVNPVYWAKGHQGSIKIGPNVLNKLSPSGEIGMLSPSTIPQVDRDIEQLVQFSNILNKNPEVRQGQIESKGVYQSAKTLEELAGAIDNTIDDYWDIVGYGFERLLHVAFRMDEELWPNEEKRISNNIKGKRMRDLYIPSRDIDGHYTINVDYGFGIGGYQGFLQNLQANQAKVRSRKAAIEAMPGVSDVDQEIRQIQLEDLSDAQMANIQAQAAQGAMDMVMMARLRGMVEKGMTVEDAVLKLQEEAEAQAAAAAQEGSQVAPITTPAQPEAGPPEEAPLPGLNPAAVA